MEVFPMIKSADRRTYRKNILKVYPSVTDTHYTDIDYINHWDYLPTVDNAGLKEVKSYYSELHHKCPDNKILTETGEKFLFKAFDMTRKKLESVTKKLMANDNLMPSFSDMKLYDKYHEQLTILYMYNIRLTGIAIKKYTRTIDDKTRWVEIENEANYHLYMAISRFDYTRGFKFSTFYCNVAFNNIGSYLRTEHNRIKRLLTNDHLNNQDENLEFLITSREKSPVDMAESKDIKHHIDKALGKLTEQERTLISEYYFNTGEDIDTYPKICDKHNISRSKQVCLMRSAMKKLRNMDHLRDLIGVDAKLRDRATFTRKAT